MKISEIKTNPNNPRLIKDDKFRKLCQSIKDFPQMMELRPIIIDDENVILGGNMRFRACKENGMKELPDSWVKKASELTEEQKKEFVIKDNSNFGNWDFDDLANNWDVEDLNKWGLDFPDWDVEAEKVEAVEDNYEMPEEIKTDIVLGDLFEIGEHRLLCGDSTKVDDVEKLMDGKKADMVFTDPPYGMFLDTAMSKRQTKKGKWNSTPKDYDIVLGDHEDFTPELINTIFASFSYCKEIFIWGADYFAELLPKKNNGSWIVWDKRAGVETMKWSTSEFELCWSKSKHHRKIARITWSGILGTEQEHDHSSGRKHPTQKPTLLPIWFFDNWGKENDLVADMYGGSGSTMVACHQTKRICYMQELDPKYCQVIIDRMLKLDPTLEIKKNGEPYIINRETTGN